MRQSSEGHAQTVRWSAHTRRHITSDTLMGCGTIPQGLKRLSYIGEPPQRLSWRNRPSTYRYKTESIPKLIG